MLNLKNLLTIALVLLTLGGCTKKTPITLADQQLYLISMDKWESKYKQVVYQFKDTQRVAIFWMIDMHVADVTMGFYKLTGNEIKLPIGTFEIRPGIDGFDLYNFDGLHKYKMTRKESPYIRPGAKRPKNKARLALAVQ